MAAESHWDAAYTRGGSEAMGWYQAEPEASLGLIARLALPADAAIIDVGGGASILVDRLLDQGYTDVTVLDISDAALSEAKDRLTDNASVTWMHTDLLEWRPLRKYDLWHDRAVLHFLVDDLERTRYGERLREALAPGGYAVIGTFAPDGPDHCSGLPVRRYSATDLAAMLGHEFEAVEELREVHTTPGAVAQPFTWISARRGAVRTEH